ncbi:MAG: hypothetical protein GWN82_21650, partial [Gemmatimonadetes bacterium]|nr:hypothetical protein [Actinomycetota bacterium]NIT89403.1 hypothetical protein [Gemmatimonadota bacterium]NIU33207.1 hypothetical protein [Gemmatimonadota bacterium]NIW66264.1 hypothetical protein [Gemmatimonadota bacterium]NIX41170.1 hypothetical protein [Gemmatimonadota bacterium]
IVSHALYLPATILTWASLSTLGPPLAEATSRIDPSVLRPGMVDALAGWLVTVLGPILATALGVAGLFLGVALFDRALRGVDLHRIRERISL